MIDLLFVIYGENSGGFMEHFLNTPHLVYAAAIVVAAIMAAYGLSGLGDAIGEGLKSLQGQQEAKPVLVYEYPNTGQEIVDIKGMTISPGGTIPYNNGDGWTVIRVEAVNRLEDPKKRDFDVTMAKFKK